MLVEGHNSHRTQQPLSLMASKSWVGHSEPAAGIVGMAHATLALAHSSVLGICHMREINPYVVNSMKVAGEGTDSVLSCVKA